MHKDYRDLQERVELQAAQIPEAQHLLEQVGAVDDLDPLRVPALKAMKREPAPPLELTFRRENHELVVYARNTARKRRAQQPTRCATVTCPGWLFDPTVPAPPSLTPALRLDLLAMIKESYALLGQRISNYFPVTFRDELVIQPSPVAHLSLRELPLAKRVRLLIPEV